MTTKILFNKLQTKNQNYQLVKNKILFPISKSDFFEIDNNLAETILNTID